MLTRRRVVDCAETGLALEALTPVNTERRKFRPSQWRTPQEFDRGPKTMPLLAMIIFLSVLFF